jgi:hypothetical protein
MISDFRFQISDVWRQSPFEDKGTLAKTGRRECGECGEKE